MLFTKQEIQENYPLEERMKLEKAKSQNSTIYWINELISETTPGADDVPSLIKMHKNMTEQVEDLYREKEALLAEFPGVYSFEDLVDLIHDMENQLSDLYKEKEVE